MVRSDRAFIGKVIASMRPWREFCASVERLTDLEDASRKKPGPPRIPPHLEWWSENFMLIRDITTRRYAVHVESFDRLLREPEETIAQTIAQTIDWLGSGDVEQAISRVKPEHRHFEQPESDVVSQETAQVFDDLYGAVHNRQAIQQPLLQRLNETHQLLLPELQAFQERVLREARAAGRGPV